MKLKSKLSKLVSVLTVAVMCFTVLPKASTFSSSAANVGDKLSVGNGNNQHKGNCDGYSYEVWIDNTGGSGSMTLSQGAAFKAEWNASVNSGNFLARRGLDFGSQKKATDYPYIGMDYEADYRQTGSSNGNSRLCVYGWFQNKNAGNVPLVEYYIIEDWVDWCPDANGKMVTIDGAQYKIFQMDHTGPTINGGSETFKQYFSVRQQKRTSGHITVSDHFKAWAEQGWGIGNLYEVALNAEGWQSSGVADIKKLDVYTDPDKRDPNIGDITDTPVVEPDKNGDYFKSTFDTSNDGWTARGDASVVNDSENYYAGGSSLLVTGRTDNWHGASIALDSNAFVGGNSYSFSTGVLQKSGDAVDMQLTLQYSLDGEEHYDKIASVSAKSGEWTKLENTSFTIPKGASNLLLYVEAPDSLTDFYIDEAKGSKEGTKSSVTTGGGTVKGENPVESMTTTTVSDEKTTTTTTAKPVDPDKKVTKWGDANCDGEVRLNDAVLVMQAIGNPDVYGISGSSKTHITEQGMLNGDVNEAGNGLTNLDALAIQKYLINLIDKLPESIQAGNDNPYVTTTTTKKPVNTTTTTAKPNVPDAEFFMDSFSNGTDGWEKRGAASLSLDKDTYYSEGSSLKVTGREDTWQGAAKSLDNSYKAGETYSFSAGVLQASGSSQEVKMTLQYNLDGEEKYDEIAKSTAADKTWTKIENTEYTIPDGATDLLIYVELPDSNADYYLDDVQVDAKGAKSKVETGKGTVGTISNPSVNPSGKVDPTKPMVAISFDDGASPATGTRIIDALAKQDFRATFFYVGNWIRGTDGENEVKYAYSKGMEIANHTMSHPNLAEKSASEIRKEYDQCASKLKGIIGTAPSKLLRLPYLSSNQTVQSTLNDAPLITCSIDTQDWNGASKDQIVNTVKQAVANGSADGAIILCHETYETTAAAIEELAPYLKNQGWQIVTVSEMFEAKGKQMSGGQIYTKCN